jgi:YVTN family beta-propeller protein
MRFKTILVAVLVLALTACGHTRDAGGPHGSRATSSAAVTTSVGLTPAKRTGSQTPAAKERFRSWSLTKSRTFPDGEGGGWLMSPDGRHLYDAVAVSGKGEVTTASAVNELDIESLRTLSTVKVPGEIDQMAISPDGRHLYAAGNTDTISVIDTVSNKVVKTFTVNGFEEPLALVASGHSLYVGTESVISLGSKNKLFGSAVNVTSGVSVVDTTSYAVTSWIGLGSADLSQAPDLSSGRPGGLVVSPDGSQMYVARNYGDDATGPSSLDVVDLTTHAVAQIPHVLPINPDVGAIAMSPDGRYVFVASGNRAHSEVSVIDTGSRTVVATVNVPGVDYVAVSADGQYVYAACHAGLSVIDVRTRRVLTTVSVAGGGPGLAVSPDGRSIYFVQQSGGAGQLGVIAASTKKGPVPSARGGASQSATKALLARYTADLKQKAPGFVVLDVEVATKGWALVTWGDGKPNTQSGIAVIKGDTLLEAGSQLDIPALTAAGMPVELVNAYLTNW